MARTLYISDLDGTLLNQRSELDPQACHMLNDAIGRGALFSVATARTPATVSHLLKDVDVSIPLVVMTGAALWNLKTGEYADVQHFEPRQVREVIEAYRAENAAAFLYTLRKGTEGTADKLHIYHFGHMNHIEREFMEERLSSPFKEFEVPESGESLIPEVVRDAVLFFGMQPNEEATGAYRRLQQIEGINPMFYHDWHGDEIAEVEAFPEGATKAKAVRRLARKVGADRIVVFGDNVNDISMMKVADLAVAVGNAVDEVKEVAHTVIGTNLENAVPRFILSEL